MDEEILTQIPGKFVAEFKALNQALQFQFAELPLLCELHAAHKHQQGATEMIEALLPTHI